MISVNVKKNCTSVTKDNVSVHKIISEVCVTTAAEWDETRKWSEHSCCQTQSALQWVPINAKNLCTRTYNQLIIRLHKQEDIKLHLGERKYSSYKLKPNETTRLAITVVSMLSYLLVQNDVKKLECGIIFVSVKSEYRSECKPLVSSCGL